MQSKPQALSKSPQPIPLPSLKQMEKSVTKCQRAGTRQKNIPKTNRKGAAGLRRAIAIPAQQRPNPLPVSFNIPTKTMSCILHIETSTDVCSVALSQDGVCLHEEIDTNGRRHAEILAPFVEEAVSFADSHAIPLDAVSVSAGPGSYTGLRIGVSTAKGLCYGRDLKLISIPTLKVLCTPILLYREDIPDNALLCPMIDARRMEVYTAIYDRALHEVVPTDAVIVNENSFAEILDKQPVFFFGNGADKCRDTLKHPNAHFIEGIVPKASNMLPLAERALALNKTEDIAYYEPFYLKQFVAGKSKNLLNG